VSQLLGATHTLTVWLVHACSLARCLLLHRGFNCKTWPALLLWLLHWPSYWLSLYF